MNLIKNLTNIIGGGGNRYNLKSIFALSKLAKISLSILSIIALLGIIATYTLNKSIKNETFSSNLILKSQDSRESSGVFAYNLQLDFPKYKPLLRSKSISNVNISRYLWNERVNQNAIQNLQGNNRNLWFESTQDLKALGLENIGVVEYKVDFSPLIKNIARYYLGLAILIFLFCSKVLYFIITTNNKKAKIVLAIIAFFAMSASFYNNAFYVVDSEWFNTWQRDTESHIIARSLADIYGLETQGYGLGFLKAGDIETYGAGSDEILEKGIVPQSYMSYKSAVGIQGYIWSFAYRIFNDLEQKRNHTHLKNLKPLYVICASLSAISILIIAFLLGKIFGNLFGVVFFASMFLSPWITNYGNNLYHNFWAWLLPSIFSFSIFLLLCKNDKKPKKFTIFCLGLGYILAMFFKSLMSYEYLTSIVLFSLSPFFIAPFMAKLKATNLSLKSLAKQIATLFALSVLGFCFAFSIQATLRGNGDFAVGVQKIYKEDFLRRMIGGNAQDFNPAYSDSLNANAIQVIAKYLDFHTPIIVGLHFNGAFLALILANVLLLIFAFKGAQRRYFGAMLVVFALVAISWFVLGKSHSFIHTHMNFVVWHLGFVAVLLYIPLVAILKYIWRVKSDVSMQILL